MALDQTLTQATARMALTRSAEQNRDSGRPDIMSDEKGAIDPAENYIRPTKVERDEMRYQMAVLRYHSPWPCRHAVKGIVRHGRIFEIRGQTQPYLFQ